MIPFGEFTDLKRREMARFLELRISEMYGVNVCVDVDQLKLSIVDDYSASINIQCEVKVSKEKFDELGLNW